MVRGNGISGMMGGRDDEYYINRTLRHLENDLGFEDVERSQLLNLSNAQ